MRDRLVQESRRFTRNWRAAIICNAAQLTAGLIGISNPSYAESPPMQKWVDAPPIPPPGA